MLRCCQARQQSRPGATSAAGPARTADIGVRGSILVAGLAGCANAAITHPLWGASLQMQNNYKSGDPELIKQSVVQILRQRYRVGGVRELWKGLPAALLMVVNPTVQFLLYEWLTARLLESRRGRAAAAAAAPTCPASTKGASASRSGLRPRKFDLAQLPVPLPVTLAAPMTIVAVLGSGVLVVVLLALCSAALSPMDAFLLSALAKLGATLVTYPMLLIKSRLQASSAATASEARYRGVLHAVLSIVRLEGWAGLFKGMQCPDLLAAHTQVKMVQTVLAAALLMSIKEQVYRTTRVLLLGVRK
ncbi:hypothetical protein QJQ45_012952 [Haematococcus lacustris]|nr:hypothetical protein QJQ45_012952 [Haematococcus lacustris]